MESREENAREWVRKRLKDLERELVNAELEHEEVLGQIAELKQAIKSGYEFLALEPYLTAAEGGETPKRPDHLVYVGLTIADAAAKVLGRTSQPLNAEEIWRRLEAGGVRSDAKNPVMTVVAALSREKQRFRRTAPNTFTLVIPDAVDHSPEDGPARAGASLGTATDDEED